MRRIWDGNPSFKPVEAPTVSASDSLREVKRLRRFERAQLDRPDSAGIVHLPQDFRPLSLLHEHIGEEIALKRCPPAVGEKQVEAQVHVVTTRVQGKIETVQDHGAGAPWNPAGNLPLLPRLPRAFEVLGRGEVRRGELVGWSL